MKFTKKEIKKYLIHGGVICPKCGSDLIRSIGEFDSAPAECWQEIECTNCQITWTDLYKLQNIEIGKSK